MIKKTGKTPKGLNTEDKRLWKHVTKDVEPLDPEAQIEILPEETTTVTKTTAVHISPPRKASVSPVQRQLQGFDLDRRSEDRFRKGQMTIDLVIDLHGLSAAQAQDRLTRFIIQAHASQKRCLLVITGKGGSPKGLANSEIQKSEYKGVIRNNLKTWLETAQLKSIVLSVAQAKPQHGGGGAFYILLRRQR